MAEKEKERGINTNTERYIRKSDLLIFAMPGSTRSVLTSPNSSRNRREDLSVLDIFYTGYEKHIPASKN